MSLLKEFIKEKLEEYVEPQRKGTPRGKDIGFSKEKYQAALELMTNLRQQTIANNVGVTHSILRFWNTESGFRKLINSSMKEFTDIFISYIEKYYDEQYSYLEKLQKLNNKKLIESNIFKSNFRELNDSFYYSSKLQSQIWLRALKLLEVKKEEDSYDYMVFCLVLFGAYISMQEATVHQVSDKGRVKKKPTHIKFTKSVCSLAQKLYAIVDVIEKSLLLGTTSNSNVSKELILIRNIRVDVESNILRILEQQV